MVVACHVPPWKKAMSTLLHVWSAKLSCGSTQQVGKQIWRGDCWHQSLIAHFWFSGTENMQVTNKQGPLCLSFLCRASLHEVTTMTLSFLPCCLGYASYLSYIPSFRHWKGTFLVIHFFVCFMQVALSLRGQSLHPSAGTASSPHQRFTHHTIGGKLCSRYRENRDTFEWKIPALAISCMPNQQYFHNH